MRHIVTATVCLVVAATTFRAQSPAAATTKPSGLISGVVRDGATTQPLTGVVVELRVTGAATPLATITRVVTDDRGRYAFVNLPAAREYTVQAMRPDYTTGAYGQSSMFGQPGRIPLSDGEWFTSANVLLWRPSAISGRVTDERGEPVVGVWVRALARVVLAGESHWLGSASIRTDDRGEYRIAGLGPGEYTVVVPSPSATVPEDAPGVLGQPSARRSTLLLSMPGSPSTEAALAPVAGFRLVIGNHVTPPPDPADGKPRVYPTSFYPGVDQLDAAQTIRLGQGDQRGAADVTLRPAVAVNVFGRVVGPPESLKGLLLRLMVPGMEGSTGTGEAASALVRADGSFAFLRVPPGQYLLDAPSSLLEFSMDSGAQTGRPPTAPGFRIGGSSSGSLPSGPPGLRFQRMTSPTRSEGWWARMPVSIGDAGERALQVMMQPTVTLRGRFEYVATTRGTIESSPVGGVVGGVSNAGGVTITTLPRPSTQPIIAAEPATAAAWLGMPTSSPAPPDADQDVFSIPGVLQGEYVLRVRTGAGRYVIQSVRVDGRDVTHRPIDTASLPPDAQIVITFTDQVTTLTGDVVSDEPPGSAAAVLVFPTDRREWSKFGLAPARLQSASLAGTTRFSITALPAGSYFVAAVDALPPDGWQTPAYLDKVASIASTVTLAWGESSAVQLRLGGVR